MSATAGIWDMAKRHSSEELQQQGNRMMQSMERYPADASGIWQGEHLFLGCHDQWVTPESVHQRMPH